MGDYHDLDGLRLVSSTDEISMDEKTRKKIAWLVKTYWLKIPDDFDQDNELVEGGCYE